MSVGLVAPGCANGDRMEEIQYNQLILFVEYAPGGIIYFFLLNTLVGSFRGK